MSSTACKCGVQVGYDIDELAHVRRERDELQGLLDKFERHMAEVHLFIM